MSAVVEIYEAQSSQEAHLARHALQQAGIQAVVVGEALGTTHGGGFAGPMNRVAIAVKVADAKRARAEVSKRIPPRATSSPEQQGHVWWRILMVAASAVVGMTAIAIAADGQLPVTIPGGGLWAAATVAAAFGLYRRRVARLERRAVK